MSPVAFKRIQGWLAIFWVVLIPVSYFAGWLSSVVYVSALSLWALVAGHWSGWQSARVEVVQEREDTAREVVKLLQDEGLCIRAPDE